MLAEARPEPPASTNELSTTMRASAKALVHRTCRAQGLPERIDDGFVLARVAAILRPLAPAIENMRLTESSSRSRLGTRGALGTGAHARP